MAHAFNIVLVRLYGVFVQPGIVRCSFNKSACVNYGRRPVTLDVVQRHEDGLSLLSPGILFIGRGP